MKRHGFFLVIFCFLAPLSAGAEDIYPVVTYERNATENVLKIKNEVKWGGEGRNFKYSVADGTYNTLAGPDVAKQKRDETIAKAKEMARAF